MPSTKRSRIDDEETKEAATGGIRVDVAQLLKSDPKQIAALGRSDDELLSTMVSFASELDTAVRDVKHKREEEKKADAKLKQQQKTASSIGCTACKKKGDHLLCCAEMGQYHQGKGSILCQKCFDNDKGTLEFCLRCNAFLCNECVKGLTRCANEECGKILCRNCLFKDDEFYCNSGENCSNKYCSSCMEANKRTRTCEECGSKAEICVQCADRDPEGDYCDDCIDELFGDDGYRRSTVSFWD